MGYHVLLKVSPWKGVIRFRKSGNLGPRYIGPFRLVAYVGKFAYCMDLPINLSQIYNTFHVSHLWECLDDDSIVVSLDDIQVDECLNYMERPTVFLDKKMKTFTNKVVGLVTVQ